MDERQRAENEALKAMFETAGWAVLVRQINEELDALQKAMPSSIPDEKGLFVSQGYFYAMRRLLAQPDIVASAEQSALQETEYEENAAS